MDDLKVYSSTVGLNESLAKDEISVYPSPTTGPLNIRLTEKSGVTPVVEVYDIVGNKVFSGVAERRTKGLYTIDLSGRNKGYYFLKIRNGNQITTRRISLIN